MKDVIRRSSFALFLMGMLFVSLTVTASEASAATLLRVYNPNSGEHHYTANVNERNHLVKVGWRYEGIAWQSGGSTPVYRLYNPNAKTGTHHYTLHAYEKDNLVRAGWRYEGIGFYSGKDNSAVRWTVWYNADNNLTKYNISRGTKFFNSENEATKWVDNYSDNLLMQGITGNYGVMSWQ